jgi:hypothetical protein
MAPSLESSDGGRSAGRGAGFGAGLALAPDVRTASEGGLKVGGFVSRDLRSETRAASTM